MTQTGNFLRHQLQYIADSTVLFECVRHEPWAQLLDSGQPNSIYGRYDIIVASPFMYLSSKQVNDVITTEVTRLTYDSKTRAEIKRQMRQDSTEPFALLNKVLAPYQQTYAAQVHATTLDEHEMQPTRLCKAKLASPNKESLPFAGGALGYFGYDLGRVLEKVPHQAAENPDLPAMMIGLYDWAVVVDHRKKTTCLVSYGLQNSTHEQWAKLCALFSAAADGLRVNEPAQKSACEFALTSAVKSNMTYAQYETAFKQVQQYIQNGDCYQVNLAQRFSATARGDSWLAYQKLREISPAPFMAYMQFGPIQVLSGSPERFLQLTDSHVETRPIKGTRPRSFDPMLDAQLAEELQTSLKDRAENVMIVDLLRNDLGKNCTTGSVRADQLFQLQHFANVHHLVSIVTGELAKDKTALDLLRGAFPGGSITGAPKLRSMQIIESLEPHQRGVYCGAIGYIGFDGNMDTNIAIRTAVFVQSSTNTSATDVSQPNGEISFYAGGGLVADSLLEKEYAETLDKASSMLKTMQYFQGSDTEFYEK